MRLTPLLLCSVLALPARAQTTELTTFLRDGIGLDATQMAAVTRGDAVVKVLATSDQRDVAIFGIVTVPMSRDAYVQRMQDPAASATQPSRVGFGVFATPATPADMARGPRAHSRAARCIRGAPARRCQASAVSV